MKISKDYLRYKTSNNKVYNFIRTLLYPSFIAIIFFRFMVKLKNTKNQGARGRVVYNNYSIRDS